MNVHFNNYILGVRASYPTQTHLRYAPILTPANATAALDGTERHLRYAERLPALQRPSGRKPQQKAEI